MLNLFELVFSLVCSLLGNSDSYGEDIGEEDSESCEEFDSEEDEYESDFIDDGDIDMFPLYPRHKSNGNPCFFCQVILEASNMVTCLLRLSMLCHIIVSKNRYLFLMNCVSYQSYIIKTMQRLINRNLAHSEDIEL